MSIIDHSRLGITAEGWGLPKYCELLVVSTVANTRRLWHWVILDMDVTFCGSQRQPSAQTAMDTSEWDDTRMASTSMKCAGHGLVLVPDERSLATS